MLEQMMKTLKMKQQKIDRMHQSKNKWRHLTTNGPGLMQKRRVCQNEEKKRHLSNEGQGST
jgi:hypothetical protein